MSREPPDTVGSQPGTEHEQAKAQRERHASGSPPRRKPAQHRTTGMNLNREGRRVERKREVRQRDPLQIGSELDRFGRELGLFSKWRPTADARRSTRFTEPRKARQGHADL